MSDWDRSYTRGSLQARDEFQRVVVLTQSRSGQSLPAGVRSRFKIRFRRTTMTEIVSHWQGH